MALTGSTHLFSEEGFDRLIGDTDRIIHQLSDLHHRLDGLD